MDIFVPIFLMTNVIITSATERLMRVFFDKRSTPAIVAFASYALYFASTSLTFLLVGIPLINLMAAILSLFVISLNYRGSMLKRLASSLCIYLILVLVDIIGFLLFGGHFYSIAREIAHTEILPFVVFGPASYLLAILLQNFKNIRKNRMVSPLYWLCTLIIPSSSVFIALTMLSSTDIPQTATVIPIAAILLINILVFYLHDILSSAYEDRLNFKLASQKNEYYRVQCRLMQESAEGLKSFKHDIKNQLTVLSDYAVQDRMEDVKEYLEKLLGAVELGEIYSQTGNIAFDSIINYKLKDAKENGIDIAVNIGIPKELNIEAAHTAAILGNLLDNALAAVEKADKKTIKLDVDYSKGALFIKMDNTFDGEVAYKNDEIASTSGEEGRGFGLKNIRKIVDQYNGHMEVKHDDTRFFVGILLYICPG
ncbi:MAG: GHKL domain-containing protein [Clostridiales bacterium]|jgi:sensor histidine kinase YesM|nr:GHKL domain-containing protein [Clostridiales bacterium]